MDKLKYLIDHTKLKPCDIILTSNKTPASKGIRLATLGRYSHAALYVGDTTIEATLNGVFSKNVQRLMFDKEDQAAVFRSKKPLSESDTLKICDYARSLTGSLYALSEAIEIRARSILRIPETRKQFCSRLVAESYKAAGYDLSNLRNPTYCTPKQLGLCKSFYQVQNVIKLGTQAEIELAESPDPNTEHQHQTYVWLNGVRSLVKRDLSAAGIDIQTINDVNNFLIIYPQYDAQISAIMRETGYLSFYVYDTKANPYRYDARLFQAEMLAQEDPVTFIEKHLDIEPSLFYKYSQNLEGYLQYKKQLRLTFFLLHIELYVNLIQQLLDRLQVYIAAGEFLGECEIVQGLKRLTPIVSNAIMIGKNALKFNDVWN